MRLSLLLTLAPRETIVDWQTYKRLCDQPDYWSAWMIDQCCQLLQASDVSEATVVDQTLRADLSRPFLPQPPNHSGDVRTQMYQVTITQEQGHLLLEIIEHAARQRLFTQGTQSRGLGGFAEACEELIRWRAK